MILNGIVDFSMMYMYNPTVRLPYNELILSYLPQAQV